MARGHIYTCALIAIALFICNTNAGNMNINEAIASQNAKAYLDIDSEPSGAKVYVGGQLVGRAPITGLGISAGNVTIMGAKRGFGTATRTIQFGQDQLKKIKIDLTRRFARNELGYDEIIGKDDGKLIIINSLGPIEVRLDGQKVGRGSVSLEGIDTGPHVLSVGKLKKKLIVYKNLPIKVKVSNEGIRILNDPLVIKAKRKKTKKASRVQAKGIRNSDKIKLVEKKRRWLAKISASSFYENTMWQEKFPYRNVVRYHKLLPDGRLYYTSEIPAAADIKPEHWQEHSRWDRWHISQGRLVICPKGDCIYWEIAGSEPGKEVLPKVGNKPKKLYFRKRN